MTRIPSIDGLRAIAALLVVLYHSGLYNFDAWSVWWVTPGWVGVRLFFVLSGALISGLLFAAQDDVERGAVTRSQAWRTFAIRRALRIFPLAYLAMLVAWLAGLPAMIESPWWHLTYTQNVGRLFGANVEGLAYFWTLAIEEQLYLLWPALILFVPRRRWPIVVVAMFVAAYPFRVFTLQSDAHWVWAGLPLMVVDAFGAGSLVAWSRREGASVTGWLAGLGAVLVAATWWFSDVANYAALETGLTLLTAAVVAWAFDHPHALAWRPLVWLGSISYGLYIWHQLGPRVLGLPLASENLSAFALKTAVGIGCAALTWYGLERPINRLKDRASQNISQNATGDTQRSPIRATFRGVWFP